MSPDALVGPLAVAFTATGGEVIADWNQGSVREYDTAGRLLLTVGTAGGFQHPNAVAVDPNGGEIYVADGGCVSGFRSDGGSDGTQICRPRLDDRSPVQIESLAVGPDHGVFALELRPAAGSTNEQIDMLTTDLQLRGAIPVGSGGSDRKLGLAVDARGDLYTATLSGYSEYAPDGSLIHEDAPGYGGPNQLVMYDGTLYGSSGPQYVVGQPWDSQIRAVAYPGPAGPSPVNQPIKMTDLGALAQFSVKPDPEFAVNAGGVAAVTEDAHILHFAPDGSPQGRWGGRTPESIRPSATTEDAAGNLFVLDTDPGRARLVEFPADGSGARQIADLIGVLRFGLPNPAVTVNGAGNFVVLVHQTLITIDHAGATTVRSVPQVCSQGCGGIAVDAAGNLWTADYASVTKYGPDGAPLFSRPIPYASALAIDGAGDVYVNGDRTITKFSPDGVQLAQWSAGGDFEPVSAHSIAVAPDGRVYATAIDGVHVYRADGTMVAVWPFPGQVFRDLAGAEVPGNVNSAPNGDVLVSGELDVRTYSWESGHYVQRFTLRNPLPPVPTRDVSPYAMWEGLGHVISATQIAGGLATVIDCTTLTGTVGAGAACAGTVALTASPAPSRRRSRAIGRTVILASSSFRVPAGRRSVVSLAFDVQANRLLRGRATLPARLTTSYATGGSSAPATQVILLRGQVVVARCRTRHPGRVRRRWRGCVDIPLRTVH